LNVGFFACRGWRTFVRTAGSIAFENATPSYCSRFGGRVALPDTTLTTKGVDTHANGRKKKDKEEGEARRQKEDNEAPEEEIVLDA
jgi:hypothetical protein